MSASESEPVAGKRKLAEVEGAELPTREVRRTIPQSPGDAAAVLDTKNPRQILNKVHRVRTSSISSTASEAGSTPSDRYQNEESPGEEWHGTLCTNGFCESCSEIKFDAGYQDTREMDRQPRLKGVCLHEIQALWHPLCPMCKFLLPRSRRGAGLCMRAGEAYDIAIHVFSGISYMSEMQINLPVELRTLNRDIGVENSSGGADLDFLVFAVLDVSETFPWRLNDYSQCFTILDGDSKPAPLSCKPITLHREVRPYIDTGLLKYWLNSCMSGHSPCNTLIGQYQARGAPYGLRVIDCVKEFVISAPPGCQYVALSYVWGRREVFPFHKRPKTISNAMKLTLQIGQRYLWVDKYCIEQDPQTKAEKDHKGKQLGAMGETYGSAFATIVAIDGASEDHGLRGVETKRSPQTIAETADGYRLLKDWDGRETPGMKLTLFPDPSWRTSWGSRGWTFQEGLLSSRIIVVFDTEVYFECRTSMCRESNSVVKGKSGHWCNLPGGRGLGNARDEDDILGLFWACAEEYFERSLTFDEDTVVAFQGVLDMFAKPPETSDLKPLPTLFGTPLLGISTYTSGMTTVSPLLSNLSWRLKGRNQAVKRRRKDRNGVPLLPSWTWAAWAGQMEPPRLDAIWDFCPLATIEIPSHLRVTYLRVTAPVYPARMWNGEPHKSDLKDEFSTPETLTKSHAPDAELYRRVHQDYWDMAVLYTFTTGLYVQGYAIILRWLDQDKTKAERIGCAELFGGNNGDLPDDLDTQGKHTFDLC